MDNLLVHGEDFDYDGYNKPETSREDDTTFATPDTTDKEKNTKAKTQTG